MAQQKTIIINRVNKILEQNDNTQSSTINDLRIIREDLENDNAFSKDYINRKMAQHKEKLLSQIQIINMLLLAKK